MLRVGDIVIDVGANIGYYSLLASQVVASTGRVYAIEPIERNVEQLRQSIKANHISNIVTQQAAAGAKKGEIELYISDDVAYNSGWVSMFPFNSEVAPSVVEMITIDEYIFAQAIERVNFIKIDVEGGEPGVLRGMAHLLSQADAPIIMCEVNTYWLEQQSYDSRSITEYLSDFGYIIYSIGKPNFLQFTQKSSLSPFLKAVHPSEKLSGLVNLLCLKRSHHPRITGSA